MPRVQASTHIQAPPEAVWTLLSDFSRIPEYVHFVLQVFDYTEGPLRVGSKYAERAKPGPFESVSHWEITECAPPHRQVHVGIMPEMNATLTIELKPADSGTHYTQRMEFTFLPRFRPLGWLLERLVIRRKMESDFQKIVASVKRIVETKQET